jgi:hypothetical protein
VGAEQRWVEADAGDPLGEQAGILPGREAAVFATAAIEQEIAGTLPGCRKALVDRLARLFGDLEPDRRTGFALPYGRAIDGIAVRSDVLDLEAHHVAPAQLAGATFPGRTAFAGPPRQEARLPSRCSMSTISCPQGSGR